MKRPRDKNYKDHVVKALPAAKTKTEEAWENPSVTKRAEEFQANLSDEFPSFLKIMIPSNVCRGYYMVSMKLLSLWSRWKNIYALIFLFSSLLVIA